MGTKQFALAGAALLFSMCLVGSASSKDGVDHAVKGISIETPDTSVQVTTQNITTNTENGNRSRVLMTVNGAAAIDKTADAAEVSESITICDRGRYSLELHCYNHRATAYRCAIRTNKADSVERY